MRRERSTDIVCATPSSSPAPSPTAAPPASNWRIGVAAIRPRTLGLAATPVLLGSALAWADGAPLHALAFIAALACALLIQIGTNLHNDVADYLRGTDTGQRIGPLRVTAAGWVRPQTMVRASLLCFAAALALGVYLVEVGGWPILLAGLASLAAGYGYSGGPRPISHGAWGEAFVLVFFGLVAVAGSHWLQAGAPALDAWLGGAALGLPAAGVLLVNNYRDLEGDLEGGRRTLVARLGRAGSRRVYALLMTLPFAVVAVLALRGRPGALLALALLPFALMLVRRLGAAAPGPWLNGQLAATAKASALLGLLLAAGVLL
ncbi:MAG: 1,4-dihydroxy-2-naphthoate octaprenyltransferase [Betaproteobacteria bacterium]|nr:1,4-dihydroxy-2-naphthoate octaprenyltransferase [Betaproteobacteria bacterium]